MPHDLPKFQKVRHRFAAKFINEALSGPRGACLIRLTEFDDHHFRVVFKRSYFELIDGAELPSRSQWNTLKKKLKRRDRRIFVFRDYGPIDCAEGGSDESSQACLFLDFGFLLDWV